MGTVCPGTICAINGTSHLVNPDLLVDCRGEVGKYLSLQLPGTNRVLGLVSLEPHTTKPDLLSGEEGFVCYGVRSIVPTPLEPEYHVTSDPEDPTFYSTCYVRKENITWLPPIIQSVYTQWSYNHFCVDCEDYHRNSDLNNDIFPVVPWHVSEDNCYDCEQSVPTLTQPEVLSNHTGTESRCRNSDTCDSSITCSKQLYMKGRTSSRFDVDEVIFEECELIVLNDPECSELFLYAETNGKCYCYRNDDCCGSCDVSDGDYDIYKLL